MIYPFCLVSGFAMMYLVRMLQYKAFCYTVLESVTSHG